MSVSTPRIRALLRQADKIAASGKRSAAENLYRQIIEEEPKAAPAWIGLAQVIQDTTEQEEALERALALDPENAIAKIGLTAVRNGQSVVDALSPDLSAPPKESKPARPERFSREPVVKETRVEKAPPVPEPAKTDSAETALEEAEHGHATFLEGAVVEKDALYCTNHPNTLTHLRCNKCGKPVCAKCVRPTPVGYRCKECIREHEDVFFTATIVHYVIAAIVAFPLGIIAGFISVRLGFLVIFFAAFAGSIIARIVHRLIGRKRGRWMPHLVASAVIVGGLLPAVLPILAILFGQESFSLFLLWVGIYIVVAASAAFYQMK